MQVKETGESECRPVMGRTGIEPQGDIILRESGQTSGGSLVAREFEEPSARRKANDGRNTGWCASGWEVAWHGRVWAEAHGTVRRLQMSIAKVVQNHERPASVTRGFVEA